jgi:hypothetical protein
VDIALEPLERFRSHSLYPQAQAEVLRTKAAHGVNVARLHAYNIADAMDDARLLAKLRKERKA